MTTQETNELRDFFMPSLSAEQDRRKRPVGRELSDDELGEPIFKQLSPVTLFTAVAQLR
jgi:hypothetical protein